MVLLRSSTLVNFLEVIESLSEMERLVLKEQVMRKLGGWEGVI
jgi:hypothetical protein